MRRDHCAAAGRGGQARTPGRAAGQDQPRGEDGVMISTVAWISTIYCVCLQNAALYSISPWSLAIRRVPALLLTMSLELVGGVVIDQLHKVATVLECRGHGDESMSRLSRPTPSSSASCPPSPRYPATWGCRPAPTPSAAWAQVSSCCSAGSCSLQSSVRCRSDHPRQLPRQHVEGDQVGVAVRHPHRRHHLHHRHRVGIR